MLLQLVFSSVCWSIGWGGAGAITGSSLQCAGLEAGEELVLLQLVFSSVCWSRGWGGAGAITAGLLFSVLVLRLGRSWCYYSWSSLQCAGLEAGEELVLLQLIFSSVSWS